MARVAEYAGYGILVFTLQKPDKFGKVWVLAGLLRHMNREGIVYYEDAATVIDDLKARPEGRFVTAVHILSPEFEGFSSKLEIAS